MLLNIASREISVHLYIFPLKYTVRQLLAGKQIMAAYLLSAVAYLQPQLDGT